MDERGCAVRWLQTSPMLVSLVLGCAVPEATQAATTKSTSAAIQAPPEVAFPSIAAASTKYCEYRDVRKIGAKGDGVTDDTWAFKKAIAAKKSPPFEWLTLYVPNGTYLVSDTIGWSCRVTVVGQDRAKTIINLKNRCAGFTDSRRPKPVFHTAMPGGNYGNDSVANAAFHNYILNLTIDTGRGNPGAIGACYTTHNSGILGDVTVRSGDGQGVIGVDMSRTEFGPGMLRNLTVEGFDIGIKSPGNVSSVAMANITLRNQKVVGFDNYFPASIHGFVSENKVPAIRNRGGSLGLLVLFDAKLSGGSREHVAIENKASMNLRNVTCSGYGGILKNNGSVLAESRIDDLVVGPTHSGFPSPKRHLNIPTQSPPPVYDESPERWVAVDSFKADGDKDYTSAIQKAIDSGAKTIYFEWGREYEISDTIHVRGEVRRIFGMGVNITGPKEVFVDQKKPMFRFDGSGTYPVVVQNLSMGIWPHRFTGMEIATSQTIYLDSCVPAQHLRTTKDATGTLFVDEMTWEAEFNGRGTIYVRQLNTENNPFDTRSRDMKNRTYIRNNGARLWILSMKTESPAIHVHTKDGGVTELLGGFFRDHFGPSEYGGQVPFFITEDSSLSASYVSYAHAPGKSRTLQGVEIRRGVRKEALVDCFNMALYSSYERKPGDVELKSFEADSMLLTKGETCELRWDARNASSVWIKPNIGKVSARGSRRVRIDEPTTFMLQANGPGGPEIGQVEVLMYRQGDAPASTSAGLDCAYYEFEGRWDALPDFSALKLRPIETRTVAKADLSLARRKDNYALVFTGYLEVPTDGIYTLYTTSDDGSAFYLGDHKVVDNDGLHGAVERSGRIALEAGKHAVRIPFFQVGGGAEMFVSYEGPGIRKQQIPSSAWSHRR